MGKPLPYLMQGGIRSCLRCEGHGVIRNYLNRAGDYEKEHCPSCEGIGKKFYAPLNPEPEPKPTSQKEYDGNKPPLWLLVMVGFVCIGGLVALFVKGY